MARPASDTQRRQRRLGRGRSAVVDAVVDEHGRLCARKLFRGERLATLVNVALTGAANPYGWNRDAVTAAAARRLILAGLVELWFGERLRLPRLIGVEWDGGARAFALTMELIEGRPAALRHPFGDDERRGELRELRREVMAPLQRHLIEAGFDGLAWQAGLGNPVASANFLLERSGGSRRWVWIDLESGVPALFPLDPGALLRFYVPASLRHGRPLFDDVDVERLRRYLERQRPALLERLGATRTVALEVQCDRLDAAQRRWRAAGRLERSIGWALARGWITEAEAARYRRRPVRWSARLAARAARRLARGAADLAGRIGRRLRPARLMLDIRAVWSFCTSGRWRSRSGRRLVLRRIASWRRRSQLTADETRELASQLRREEAIEYVTDFGIHLAIKPPIKLAEYALLPALVGLGAISPTTALVGMATGGVLGRTLYTSGRLLQATWRRRERPWVALAVGLLPIVGNAAYPAQIVYTSTERAHDAARFILFDLFTSIGRRIPVWGGADTITEHAFNRIPDLLLRRFARRGREALSSTPPEARAGRPRSRRRHRSGRPRRASPAGTAPRR